MKDVNSALVSIIIPLYRVEPYIVRCLKSVVNQDYKNIEIILVDDCGGDRSLAVGQEYLDSAGINYKSIVNEKNSGPSFSRNEGLKSAEGKYIFFADADDCLDEHCISHLVSVMENPKLEADIAFSDFRTFQEDSDIQPFPDELRAEKANFAYNIDFVRKHGYVWGVLYKTDVIRKNSLRMPADISYMEDNIWNIDYLELVGVSRAYFVKSAIYFYFKNPQSLSRPGSREVVAKKTLDCLNFYEKRFYKTDSGDARKNAEMIKTRRYLRNCFFDELYTVDRGIRSVSPEKYKGGMAFCLRKILKSDLSLADKISELAAAVPFLERAVYKIKFRFFNK